jgi:hypothetical protein
MLERATAKSPGRRRPRSPSEVRAGGWVFARSGLTSLERPSMKWLETAFAEDVGGALLAFRAGRHRVYLSLGRCQNPLHPKLLRAQTRTAEPLPDQGAYPAIWCRSLVRSQDRRSLRSESRCQFRHHALLLGRAFGAAASPAREARKSSSDTAYYAANHSWLRCSWRSNFASRKRPHAS